MVNVTVTVTNPDTYAFATPVNAQPFAADFDLDELLYGMIDGAQAAGAPWGSEVSVVVDGVEVGCADVW